VTVESGGDETDWARVLAMTEDELEAAIATDPDWAALPRDWYKDARHGVRAGSGDMGDIVYSLDLSAYCAP
jgi:hypothetical protein